MNNQTEQSKMSNTFKNLIVYFLERQRLVSLALLDIAPILLRMEGKNRLPVDLEPYIERFESKQAQIQSPQEMYQGTWKEEWKYRIHGIGCRLCNLNTEELLEWDAPNLLAFRFDWFWQHLAWRSRYESQDPFIEQAQRWMISLPQPDIKQVLVDENIIQVQQDGLCLLQ